MDAVLNINKPSGLTSFAVVSCVRRLCRIRRVGHAGTLDPLADGVLLVLTGQATRIARYLEDQPKEYRAVVRLGVETDTYDLSGRVTAERPLPALDRAAVEAVLERFIGAIEQVPPMYSALKQGGQRLYRLARQGIEVERPAREIAIRRLELEDVSGNEATMRVVCSKGTYVRTLAEDLARAVGSCAHLSMLRRLGVQPFESQSMVTLEQVEAQPGTLPLMPPDAALPHLAEVALGPDAAQRLAHGQEVYWTGSQDGALLRLYGPGRRFLGIGQFQAPDRVRPVRLFNHLGPAAT
jgi:tRNA pseudouridine55 synthase